MHIVIYIDVISILQFHTFKYHVTLCCLMSCVYNPCINFIVNKCNKIKSSSSSYRSKLSTNSIKYSGAFRFKNFTSLQFFKYFTRNLFQLQIEYKSSAARLRLQYIKVLCTKRRYLLMEKYRTEITQLYVKRANSINNKQILFYFLYSFQCLYYWRIRDNGKEDCYSSYTYLF